MRNVDECFLIKLINTIEKYSFDNTILLSIYKYICQCLSKTNIDIFELKKRKNNKKILSVEVGAGHDVIRPSIYKYFTDLGYEVDFLLYGNNPQDRWNFFINIKDVKYRQLVGNEAYILFVMSLPIIKEYDYVLFNSNFVYTPNRIDTDWDYKEFLKYMGVFDKCKYGYLTIPPHPVVYKQKDKNVKILTHLGSNNTPMISISYFGDVNITPKSDKNIFLLTGNINNGQKNHDMVLSSIRKLLQQNITNFEVWINGQAMKEFNIPEELEKNEKYLGENKPETLFPILEKVDFIISGIDSDDQWQEMVYANGTCSVGFMYSMGFGKVYICEDIFAKAFRINETNSIIYKQGDLTNAIKTAINMSGEEYLLLQSGILEEAKNRYNKSLSDIELVLDLSKKTYRRTSRINKILREINKFFYSMEKTENRRYLTIMGIKVKTRRNSKK